MSGLTDYSKWDALDSDVESDTEENKSPTILNTSSSTPSPSSSSAVANTSTTASLPPGPPAPHLDGSHLPAAMSAPPASSAGQGQQQQQQQQPPKMAMTKKASEKGRYIYSYQGRTIYEWSQTLDTISIYITTPPNVTGSQCLVTISARRLKVGVRGWSQLYIDEALTDVVDVSESTWSWMDGELAIDLCKVARGRTWESPLEGKGGLDPVTREEVKKDMMLERFQEENPGFDFRNAEFNGGVPDARDFMGGVGAG